MYFGLKREEE